MTNTTYRLTVLGENGMYTYGERAATPELAKLAKGNLCRTPYKAATRRLAIEESHRLPGLWTDSAGNQHERWSDSIVVEVEPEPGIWTIG